MSSGVLAASTWTARTGWATTTSGPTGKNPVLSVRTSSVLLWHYEVVKPARSSSDAVLPACEEWRLQFLRTPAAGCPINREILTWFWELTMRRLRCTVIAASALLLAARAFAGQYVLTVKGNQIVLNERPVKIHGLRTTIAAMFLWTWITRAWPTRRRAGASHR